jgi:hypothetical protein
MLQPATLCSTLEVADFIRLLFPAAKMMIAVCVSLLIILFIKYKFIIEITNYNKMRNKDLEFMSLKDR